ncbi:MAG: response regulator [Calditrichaeota bacterium]|nr:MAG: response regulator [Calditrichota bacterium]MBL1203986.1 response regulator [Calditrichota bacterium]NOG43817.1 response regulator [Calditrichota bacterium]
MMEGKKVIFVEDSPTMRRIIMNSLNKIGIDDVTEAENGVDALDKMGDASWDMVITDWNMPEMNGEELVKELRSKDQYKDMPILMITTRGMQDDVMTAIKMGVNGYVVKPFTPEILKKKIGEIFTS